MFKSIDEIDKFSYEDCVLTGMEWAEDGLIFEVEALIVKENNSQNSNFTESYAGPATIKLVDGRITDVIKTGFKYYDAERIIMGKKMKEHLPFAMAWWHNLCATGTDMFGRGVADKSFGAKEGTMEHAKAKVDAGFEFMKKLGVGYFCFHDVDIVPEADEFKYTLYLLSI